VAPVSQTEEQQLREELEALALRVKAQQPKPQNFERSGLVQAWKKDLRVQEPDQDSPFALLAPEAPEDEPEP
jgi:hypothetical protein